MFVSVKDSDKPAIVPAGARADRPWVQGRSRPAGTADYLAEAGSPVERINKVAEGRPHIVDRIKDGGIDI